MSMLFGNVAVVALALLVLVLLLSGLLSILVHGMQRDAADICQYVFAAEPVIEATTPAEFPRVKAAEYDSDQKLLEDRGYRFACDGEIVNFRGISADPRAFMRYMLSRDGTVRVSFVYSHHRLFYRIRERVFGKMRGRVAVEVNVEARDGRHFTVMSSFTPITLRTPPEIITEALKPGLGVLWTLYEFEERYAAFREANPNFEPLSLSGAEDVLSSDMRHSRLINAYRVRIGFLTVDEVVAGGMKNRDEAEKVVKGMQKELWRRGVMK